ncbi:MAG: hydrolase, variant 1 family protein [Planctomycetaceae bacterium]|nr:hydrolase, variant 1 family protein [Planctomycetaceae bacterium]
MTAARLSPYRVLFIDFDGVLRKWPDSDAELERSYGLPAGALRDSAFERTLLHEVVTGCISDEEWRERIAEFLSQKYPGARVRDAVVAWSADIGEVNEPVLKCVQRAAEQIKVILVTNGTSRLNRDLAALELSEQFDAVVNSSVVGAAKPDREFYMAALQAAGTNATEALFVDDSVAHVAAALELGMCAHHFNGIDGLSTFLQDNGVLHKTR